MEETTPPEWSKSVLVFSLVVLLVEGGECGELVVSSPPPLVQRMEEGEELVCGTELTGRQNSPAGAESMWSEGGEEQRVAARPALQSRRECLFESPLEVDSEVDPQTVAVQETGQN